MPFVAPVADDRDRQRKALDRYEAQKRVWSNIQQKLADKVHRDDPNDTLPGSIHSYRQRVEETTILEASAPSEFRSGHHAWEMNLRCGSTPAGPGDGVRYVQLGAPYPYPLYVPVRDGVRSDPEGISMMKIIPDTTTNRTNLSKTAYTNGQFLSQRKEEFKRHIQKSFSHFIPEQGPMVVLGGAPPRTDEFTEGEAVKGAHLEPITHHAPIEITSSENSAPSCGDMHMGEEMISINRRASLASSAAPSMSGVSSQPGVSQQASVAPAASGPALVIGSANLMARVQPGEVAQLPLTVSNVGCTAVFYNWSVREQDAVPGLKGDNPENTFILSDVPSGVLLPDDEKIFVFSLRPKRAGSYSQTLELLTVPAGKDRILVHLQVFAVSDDPNIAMTNALENAMSNKALKHELHNRLAAVSFETTNNELTMADFRNGTTVLNTAQSAASSARKVEMEAEKAKWLSLNDFSKSVPVLVTPPAPAVTGRVGARGASPAPESRLEERLVFDKSAMDATRIPLPYHPAVYARLNGLHHNVQTFLAACNAVVSSATNTEAGGATSAATITTPRRPSVPPRQGSLSPRRFSTRGQTTPRGYTQQPAETSYPLTPVDVMDRHVAAEEERLAGAQRAFLKAVADQEQSASTTVVSNCDGTIPAVVHQPNPNVKWSGSVRELMEDIACVRDAPIRNRMLEALSVLVKLCVECGDAPNMSLGDMVAHCSRTDCFHDANSDVAFYSSHTSIDMAKGRIYPRSQGDDAVGGKGAKGVSKKSTNGKRPLSGGADRAVGSGMEIPEELEEARRKEFTEKASDRIISYAKDAATARAATTIQLITSVCDSQIFISEAARLSTVMRLLPIVVADVDANVEPVKKKRQ